jgi:RHS repeat-associated protein
VATTTGTARANYSYTPYGIQTATAVNGSLPANPIGYAGGYSDATTGMIHFGARYYTPATGRWTQLDPSGESGGYTYSSDDPVNSEDPTGLSFKQYAQCVLKALPTAPFPLYKLATGLMDAIALGEDATKAFFDSNGELFAEGVAFCGAIIALSNTFQGFGNDVKNFNWSGA